MGLSRICIYGLDRSQDAFQLGVRFKSGLFNIQVSFEMYTTASSIVLGLASLQGVSAWGTLGHATVGYDIGLAMGIVKLNLGF